MPKIEAITPLNFNNLYPTKIDMFIAIIPGKHWLTQ